MIIFNITLNNQKNGLLCSRHKAKEGAGEGERSQVSRKRRERKIQHIDRPPAALRQWLKRPSLAKSKIREQF